MEEDQVMAIPVDVETKTNTDRFFADGQWGDREMVRLEDSLWKVFAFRPDDPLPGQFISDHERYRYVIYSSRSNIVYDRYEEVY